MEDVNYWIVANIKELLDMGLTIQSNNYCLNKTNWGRINEHEYALHNYNGNDSIDYYYDTDDDKSYVKAIETLINDLNK